MADGCYKYRGYYTAEEMDVWVKSRKGDECLCGDCNVMVSRLSRWCDLNIHVLVNIFSKVHEEMPRIYSWAKTKIEELALFQLTH